MQPCDMQPGDSKADCRGRESSGGANQCISSAFIPPLPSYIAFISVSNFSTRPSLSSPAIALGVLYQSCVAFSCIPALRLSNIFSSPASSFESNFIHLNIPENSQSWSPNSFAMPQLGR